ncbi:MAG: flagellar brake protein [Treponema sp.]|jgi:c-di-GMP-binding flagellar brake protein YcgR|nr:flagellar brake protein [Treponema sp.]
MVFSVAQWNLLQQNIQYFKEDDPMAGFLLVITIAGIVVISFVVNLIKHGIGGASLPGPAAAHTASRSQFSRFALRRLASGYRLTREQTKLLEQIFRSAGVRDPQRIMKDPNLLDDYFKRTYKSIERTAGTEEEAQKKISLLFSLRNTIENAQRIENTITSTQQITDNSNVTLAIGDESYPVRVLSSQKENLSVECPRNTYGKSIPLSKGTRVTLSFLNKSSTRYSFDTQVLGTTNTTKGVTIQIAHSFSAKAFNCQRKFKRKQIAIACNFYLIFIEEANKGLKKKQKMILDRHGHSGTITDISIGGCAIKTNATVSVGSRLKIEIKQADNQPRAVLGQILRLNKSGSIGTIIHIKFIKVPRRMWNEINTIVFEYAS